MIHWHTQVSRKYRGQFYSENPKQTLCEGSDVLWTVLAITIMLHSVLPYKYIRQNQCQVDIQIDTIYTSCVCTYIFIYNWCISYSYIFSRVSLQLVYLPSNRVNCFHRKDANVHHYTSPLFPLRWVRRSQHFSTKINQVKAVWSSLLSDLLIRCLLAPCSMSLSVSLCGVSLLPQFCRNGVLIVLWCIECIHSKIFQISHRIWQMCTACTLQEERPSAPGTDQRPSVVRTDPSEASLIPFRMEDRKETGEVKRSEKK